MSDHTTQNGQRSSHETKDHGMDNITHSDRCQCIWLVSDLYREDVVKMDTRVKIIAGWAITAAVAAMSALFSIGHIGDVLHLLHI